MSKHVPPSRKRYEERNPALSFRVPAALKARLEALRRDHGVSGADLLRKALDAEVPILEKARQEAYKRGYSAARRKYATVFRCSGCGKQLYMTSPRAFADVAGFLEGAGWGHSSCVRSARTYPGLAGQ